MILDRRIRHVQPSKALLVTIAAAVLGHLALGAPPARPEPVDVDPGLRGGVAEFVGGDADDGAVALVEPGDVEGDVAAD